MVRICRFLVERVLFLEYSGLPPGRDATDAIGVSLNVVIKIRCFVANRFQFCHMPKSLAPPLILSSCSLNYDLFLAIFYYLLILWRHEMMLMYPSLLVGFIVEFKKSTSLLPFPTSDSHSIFRRFAYILVTRYPV